MTGPDRLKGRKTLKVAPILEELEKDRVKEGVDLVALFEGFGVALSKKGSGFMGRCPWHEDENPSLSVDREKGLYHCFGCGESGDAFSLVAKMKGLSFKESLEYLRGTPSPRPRAVLDAPLARPEKLAAPPPEPEPDTQGLLNLVAERYARELSGHQGAQEYLQGRGLLSWPLLARLGVGFCAGTLAAALSEAQKAALVAAGILDAGGREALEGCVTVPLKGAHGEALGFYGRKIDERAKLKHLYLKGPHRGLVNREALSVYREEIILTESILDAASLMALGLERVLPCYGTGGFTEEHLKALKEAGVRKLVVAFDADEAGRNGAERLEARLLDEGFAAAKIESPRAKDWNEALVKGLTKEEVEALIAAAAVTKRETESAWIFDRPKGSWELSRGGVAYAVRGAKEGFGSSMRVSARLAKEGRRYVDTVDLYSARSRSGFKESAANALASEGALIEQALLELLDELERTREATHEGVSPALTEEEEALGMAFLTSPTILDDIARDMEALGLVGEETNKLLAYLAASSRKLDDPVSVIVVSQSAAGKSFLIDTVRSLMPEEDVVSLTSLSDQALTYIPEGGLVHKLLILGEAVHNEVVEHQVREMLSAKELSRMVVAKDERSGKLSSMVVRRKAVVSLMMSTTSRDMNGENASRCFLVHADESEAQTARIHEEQNRKYSLLAMEKQRALVPEILRKHKAAQRLLRPVAIVNPFAQGSDFPSRLMRSRRDNKQRNELAAALCFLRQYQKERKKDGQFEYIECDRFDVETAWKLFAEGVMKATYLEAPESLVRLYEELRALCRHMAEEAGLPVTEVSFEQAQARKAVRWLGGESIKKYLRKLVSLEYLLVKGGFSRGQRAKYRLASDESFESLAGLEMSFGTNEKVGKWGMSG